MHALRYANELLVRVRLSFQKLSLNIQKQYEKMFGKSVLVVDKSTDHNKPCFDFYVMFLRQYQRQRKCLLSERELNKVLRDTLTRAAGLGPSNFLFGSF